MRGDIVRGILKNKLQRIDFLTSKKVESIEESAPPLDQVCPPLPPTDLVLCSLPPIQPLTRPRLVVEPFHDT
jgi:hypothetical protein